MVCSSQRGEKRRGDTIREMEEERGVRDKLPREREAENEPDGFRFACRTVKLLLVSQVAQLVFSPFSGQFY